MYCVASRGKAILDTLSCPVWPGINECKHEANQTSSEERYTATSEDEQSAMNSALGSVAYLGGGGMRPCPHPPSESPKTFFDEIHC